MTYCCGILVREGLVMFARHAHQRGRRQHLDLPQAARFPGSEKAHHGDRLGRQSLDQPVGGLSILTEGYDNPQTGERETLMNAPTMFQAAQRVGHVVRLIHAMEGKALEASDVSFDVSFLFGGQIMGERMRLFMIYSAGNFIECTTDTPYLQIGEHKYGKPVLDRAITYDMDLYDALKVGLVSIDSTMRSNLSVGMPIDLMVVRRDTCDRRVDLPHRAGRALFHRPARALVGGAARRPYRHPAPALQQPGVNALKSCICAARNGALTQY